MFKKWFSLVLMVVMLFTTMVFIFPGAVFADTVVAQQGPNPLVFNQAPSSYDGINYLTCFGAERNSGLTWDNSWGYVGSWNDSTTDYLQWTVSVPAAGTYRVFGLIGGAAGTPYKLSVVSNGSSLTFLQSNAGWDKVDAGSITIPAGTQQLKLVRTTSGGSSSFKSLELIKDSDYTQISARQTSFKADTTWFSNAKYGLMFQYGAWGYPQSGARKTLEQQANDFNVTNFVNMVKSTGATYVIWSITWYDYLMDAPIQAVDNIMGNSSLTSTRDLIGDVATALQAQGIKFGLYYHMGVNQNAAWKAKNQSAEWPDVYGYTSCIGDRTTFFNNAKSVMTDIGNRYGNKLNMFVFDCGSCYYGGPMEEFANAARSGNANRLISFNPSTMPRLTEFQDVSFGEGSHGEVTTGSAPVGGNGIFTTGPEKGLLQQGMFIMEQDWGVHTQNQAITTQITSTQAISWVQSAIARRVPLSFNMMMWEDGTVSSQSLSVLTDLKNAIYGGGGGGMVNDTASGITYSGSWSYSNGRGAGDYSNDVHYTSTNNDYCQYIFTGTGVSVIMPKDSSQGNVDIYIDNVLKQTVNTSASSYQAQQTIYSISGLSSGSHTVKIVKKDGTYMQLDAFNVTVSSPAMLNDTASGITYSGSSWATSSGRGFGDYNNDIHYTTTNNDYCQYTFTGTGISYITEKYSDEGNVDVYIDGVKQTTVNCNAASRLVQQTLYSATGLSSGSHTIKLVKISGTYMLVDAFNVTP